MSDLSDDDLGEVMRSHFSDTASPPPAAVYAAGRAAFSFAHFDAEVAELLDSEIVPVRDGGDVVRYGSADVTISVVFAGESAVVAVDPTAVQVEARTVAGDVVQVDAQGRLSVPADPWFVIATFAAHRVRTEWISGLPTSD